MKLTNVLKNVEFEIIKGDLKQIEVKNIVIDSRKVEKGSLFVCMKGLMIDSHNFIENAIKSGATCIVIENDVENLESFSDEVAFIKVENSRLTLSFIAGNFFDNPQKDINIYAFTGTNGKTSSVYFMENVLRNSSVLKGKVGIISTVETRIDGEKLAIEFATSTTPDPMELMEILATMKEKGVTDVAMEVSSHALELFKVDNLNFKVASFTNLTRDHLDLHINMENYKNAKLKLFSLCENAVINIDDEYANDFTQFCLKNNLNTITYGIENDCDLKAVNIKYANNKISFDISHNNKNHHFEIPVAGKFTVYNSLGVIASSIQGKIPIEEIVEGLANVQNVPGRIQNVSNNKDYSVIVDYAHTPDGLSNIIKAVREFTTGRVITIFGCGGDRDRSKRPIMGEIAGTLSDISIVTSDNPRTEDASFIISEIILGSEQANCEYIQIVDRKEAIFKGVEMLEKGDSLIIAGKGHEDYQIFAKETIHFDDREVAEEALKSKNVTLVK